MGHARRTSPQPLYVTVYIERTRQPPLPTPRLEIQYATMSCQLSPSAAAFGTMLSAFIGSIINGLCSGWLVAFITGWISWLSVLRILAAGAYELHLAIQAGTDFDAASTKYQTIPMGSVGGRNAPLDSSAESQTHLVADVENPPHDSTLAQQDLAPPGSPPKTRVLAQIDQSVTVFGWLGWTWSAIYTPISQTIWVCVHLGSATSGINQCVRALAIGVSALGLTFDYKARYGAVLGRKWGAWAFLAFNCWTAGACLLLGVEALVLLVHGATQIEDPPIPLLVAYPILCLVWAAGSWAFLAPVDGARSTNIIAGVLMGAFAGVAVAAPSFALWQNADFDQRAAEMMGESGPGGLDLGAFLACEGASVWAKFAAVMP